MAQLVRISPIAPFSKRTCTEAVSSPSMSSAKRPIVPRTCAGLGAGQVQQAVGRVVARVDQLAAALGLLVGASPTGRARVLPAVKQSCERSQ